MTEIGSNLSVLHCQGQNNLSLHRMFESNDMYLLHNICSHHNLNLAPRGSKWSYSSESWSANVNASVIG
jgi:hypothetical protein